jgi:hypothetical protein
MSFCTNCGHESKGGSFCAKCGSALDLPSPDIVASNPDPVVGSGASEANTGSEEPYKAPILRNSLIGLALVIVIIVIGALVSNDTRQRAEEQAIADRQAATEIAAQQQVQEERRLEAAACKNYRAIVDDGRLEAAFGAGPSVVVEALMGYASDIRQAVNGAYDVRQAGNSLADSITNVANEFQLLGNVSPGTVSYVDKFGQNLDRLCEEFLK